MILLHIGDAEINETVSVLQDLTINIVLPEEIILAISSVDSLSSHATSSHLINQ